MRFNRHHFKSQISDLAFVSCLCAALTVSSFSRAADVPATQPAAASTLLPVPENMQKDIPPPRTRAELEPLLANKRARQPRREIHVVLVAGPKDHGPGEHDYPSWQKAWHRLLSEAPQTQVSTAWEQPSEDQLESADVLVFFKHKAWPQELNSRMDAFFARGGGVVLLHFAVDCAVNPHAGEQLGLYWGKGAKFRHGWLDLKIEGGKNLFPRALAGQKLRFHDESYWRLTGDPKQIDVLATATEDDGDGRESTVPLMWNRQVGKGRVHVNILGHYNWTFNDPMFRAITLRGIAWAADEPVARFASVVTTDVRLRE